MTSGEKSRADAIRALEYAMSCTIRLLADLDNVRAQIRTMGDDQDGRTIVTPSNALAVNAAVELVHRKCREIQAISPTGHRRERSE